MYSFTTCSAGMLEPIVNPDATSRGVINSTCVRSTELGNGKVLKEAWLVYERPAHLIGRDGKSIIKLRRKDNIILVNKIEEAFDNSEFEELTDYLRKDYFYCATVHARDGFHIVAKHSEDQAPDEEYRGGNAGDFKYRNDGTVVTVPALSIFFVIPKYLHDDLRSPEEYLRKAAREEINDLAERAIEIETHYGEEVYCFMSHLPEKIEAYTKPVKPKVQEHVREKREKPNLPKRKGK